jgi:RND family efflux transporter MFP subunit
MQEGEEHGHGEAEHEDHGDHEGLLAIITQEQFKAIQIELGDLEQRNLTGILRSTGYLKVPPQNKADISAMMGGIVQSILVKEGDYISKGQTLVTLANREFITMQENYLTTKGDLLFAQQELARQQNLSEDNVSAKKNLQLAEANFNTLKTKLNSLGQQLKLFGISAEDINPEKLVSVISVKSPVSGNVSHVDVNIGSSVNATDIIMDIVDNSQLHLDLFIFEQDLMKIKIDQKINFTLTNLPGKSYSATIFAIGSAFENETKSIPVHGIITGDKTGLIEGMNVSANIEIENIKTSAVPTSAIVSEGGRDYIFIWAIDHQLEVNAPDEHLHETEAEEHDHASGEEHSHEESGEVITTIDMKPGDKYVFEKMPIKRGITEGGYTEITPLGNYAEGEKIVINGAFYLLSSLSNEGEAHAH